MREKRQKTAKILVRPLPWVVSFGVIAVLSSVMCWYVLDQARSVHHISEQVSIALARYNAASLMLHQRRHMHTDDMSDAAFPVAPLPRIDMTRMKRQGCVADGLLSGYGNEEQNVKLLNRLPCYYVHRAVETWKRVPDWTQVDRIKAEIIRSPVIYGMFIAEAINTKAKYTDTQTGQRFQFKKMCKPGTRNRWGKNTCVPDFDRKEYRRYVTQIMKEAIDHGIQVFLIGQLQVQDAKRIEKSDVDHVLDDVRDYATLRGVDIKIGAQTNDITDKDYMRLFDFIEGGIGLHADGTIEDGPCFARYLAQSNWCWALLWHENYRKARNIFVHLDWSGVQDDDMATFAAMDADTRARTLRTLYAFFTERNIGFLLPVMTALPYDHTGCHGNKVRYYSADNAYSCADESVLREILTN